MKPAGVACTICPARAAKCVPARLAQHDEGPPRARLAIIGEAPGRTELQDGEPFVGASGRVLQRGLRTLGLTRDDVHWTNAVLCDCPPAHLREAAKQCAERLRAEIAALPPDAVIVPVGAHALRSVLQPANRPRILEWRGSVSIEKGGRFVLPTIHPAFVMRAKQWGPVLEADVERVGRVMRDGWVAPEDEGGPLRRIVIASHMRQLERLLAGLGQVNGVDVETVGLGPTSTQLVCLALSDEELSVVIPWASQDGRTSYWRRHRHHVAAMLTEHLRHRVAVTHNGPAFDHIVMRRYGIHVAEWEDTLQMMHALHSHLPKRLSFGVQRYLDVPPWKTFDHAETIEALHVYNGRDTLYTARLFPILRSHLEGHDQARVYQQDKKSAELCRDMQTIGFRFDLQRAAAMAERLKTQETEIEARCAETLGKPINLLSPIQLREAFFGKTKGGGLGAHVCYTSQKTGMPSLGVDVMRAYAASPNERLAQFASDVLAYRRCRKVRITNLENPSKIVDSRSRIHSTWMNYGAVSGRFSSQGPNLMNLPTIANDPTITHCREGKCGKKCKCSCDRCAGVRSCYVARPGWTLLAFDAKQLEMRIAAYASADPVMIAACESIDLHTANADVIFGEEFNNGEDWNQLAAEALKGWLEAPHRFQMRQLAKSAGFAVCYMANAHTVYERIIAMGVKITLRQVEAMLRKMRSKFRAYYKWQADRFEEIQQTGYVYEPIGGRRRWLGKEPLPTEAANFPIQGGAAALMNLRLPEIVGALRDAKLPAKLLAQVHDSGTFEVQEWAVPAAKELIEEVFTRPVELGGSPRSFPLDFKEGIRWA